MQIHHSVQGVYYPSAPLRSGTETSIEVLGEDNVVRLISKRVDGSGPSIVVRLAPNQAHDLYTTLGLMLGEKAIPSHRTVKPQL